MSDTWREDAIVEAIQIIADKKIAQASFDKTIKAVVNRVLDETTGKYQVRYQDSLFQAYATSSKLSYQKDQMVSVLIPGNDWDRVKTILGGVENKVVTYNSIPVASNQYNAIGIGGTTLSQQIGLSSYKKDGDTYLFKDGQNGFFINTESYKYIQKGNSIALRMDIRTDLASSQVGGNYGVIFRLVFKDNVTGQQTIRDFTVQKKHVIGQPYSLRAVTPVEVLYTDVDTYNFQRIDSIQAFCQGFPQNDTKTGIKDIFISGVYINGADALTEEALNGYSLHIVDPQGTQITEDLKTITLTAQLKQSGRIVTENVQYFWGIEDATVFRGAGGEYSGYLGDGWKCLNYYDQGLRAFIPFTSPDFSFTSQSTNTQGTALASSRYNNVKCVAVLSGNTFSGQIQVINTLLGEVKIISSDKTEDDKNKTIYYLDNGNPDLICQVYNETGEKIETELKYQWSIFPSIGRGQLVADSKDEQDLYKKYEEDWNIEKEKYDRIAENQKEDYANNSENYKNAKANFEISQSDPYVYKNKYYNFPIKSISGSMKISCAVYQGNTYKGTGSITLYNKNALEGMYSLNIENGAQVFQYDTKGNSPASKQLDKPLVVQPLNFTLIDNQGKIVTHEQIRQDGWIKWIIPNTQTLLSSLNDEPYDNGETDITVIRADLPLAANRWDVYKNLDQFVFAIDDRYDSKKNINYIWLNIKYKDLILDAYTNFSFPKDGDPGTNGTDFIAKITTNPETDWVYISNKEKKEEQDSFGNLMFSDNGGTIDKLKFQLYNNSKKIQDIQNDSIFWTCPPKTKDSPGEENRTTYLTDNDSWQTPRIQDSYTSKTLADIKSDKPINIVRGQYREGKESGYLKYFAEIPICTEYFKDNGYRIKIKPKTGFKYVVYSEDGTRPDYDNTLPFEIFLQTREGDYYIADQEPLNREYIWSLIGNLEFDENLQSINNISSTGNKRYIKPKDNFTGQDLSSAIVVQIDQIGFIHIPIYMILNRYGHAALNGWDGNSIQLNKEGNTILAPQIGAGHKQDDNSYTGVFMGSIRGLESEENKSDAIAKGLDKDDNKVGFMGYHRGQRTIFLDAKTGKAEFGKNNAGRIILDPTQKISVQVPDKEDPEERDIALIYSGNYPIADFRNTTENGGNFQVYRTGQLNQNRNKDNKGLMIDLSTPQIGFGSGNFTVNKYGHIVAKGGGQIAGWSITDTKLHKDNKVGMASSNQTVPTDINLKNSDYTNDTVAFWAGGELNTSGINKGKLKTANFYTTHGGYLFSKLGQIAGWNFNSKALYKDNVGMNSDPNNTSYSSITRHNSKAFFANGDNFYVTHDGYLRSTSGQIANWTINKTRLSDGNVGMGQVVFQKANSDSQNPFGQAITARFWGASSALTIEENGRVLDNDKSGISSLNFAVSNTGKLYSKAGKIGGWNIEQNKLWSVNKTNGNGIRINADGSMSGGQGNGSNGGWAINTDGSSSFYNINAHTGEIGGCTISANGISSTNWHIYPTGLAQFSNIDVTGGIIKLGGTTISAADLKTGRTASFSSGAFTTTGGISGSGATSSTLNNGVAVTGAADSITGSDLTNYGRKVTADHYATWPKVGAQTIIAGKFTPSGTSILIDNESNYTYIDNMGINIHSSGTLILGKGGIQTSNTQKGKTGSIYFSDGSTIVVDSGLIVQVNAPVGGDLSWN